MEEARLFTGEVEIDESYFGPRRVRGRRRREAGRQSDCSNAAAKSLPAWSRTGPQSSWLRSEALRK